MWLSNTALERPRTKVLSVRAPFCARRSTPPRQADIWDEALEVPNVKRAREWRLLEGVVVASLVLSAIAFVSAVAGGADTSPHAYYLFLADAPQSCEDCYVPLVITRQTLEDVASSGGDSPTVLITTYERDSIWKVERGVPLAATDVSKAERIVRLRGRRYRWQEITPGEVLRLLDKPEGTIPIHRIAPVPNKKSLEDLIAAFRGRS